MSVFLVLVGVDSVTAEISPEFSSEEFFTKLNPHDTQIYASEMGQIKGQITKNRSRSKIKITRVDLDQR